MIKHVVIWKLRGPSSAEKRAQAERVRAALQALEGAIPGMRSLEVGVRAELDDDDQQGDVVLITTHDDREALAVYQKHPEHLKAAGVISELRSERRVVDFEV